MKILAMTDFNVDIYKGEGIIRVGGNSLNFAVQCLKSGAEHVSLLGAVGNDRYGDIVKNFLAKYRLDSGRLYTMDGRTASNKIYINERGDRYFKPDSWDGGLYETFRLSEDDWEFFRQHDVIAMPAYDPNLLTALEKKTAGNKLAADFLDTRNYEYMEKVIPQISIASISGNSEVIKRLLPLSIKIETVILVTLGAKGSTILYKGRQYHMEALPVEKVVDTTGCGDAYLAAFTVSWHRTGEKAPCLPAQKRHRWFLPASEAWRTMKFIMEAEALRHCLPLSCRHTAR